MFRKRTLPQRKTFSLTKEQIMEDIERISADEEQGNKLFFCLDEKPPQEHRFSKMEEFLKGTSNLENVSETLRLLTEDVDKLRQEISESLDKLRTRSENVTGNFEK